MFSSAEPARGLKRSAADASLSAADPAAAAESAPQQTAKAEEEDGEEGDASNTGRRSKPRPWTEGEDEQLRASVRLNGPRVWKSVAQGVPTRNHVQCMQRWQKVLKPGTRRGLWCPEEDAQLVAVVRAGGRTWKQVAQLLGGRTSKQCRERWCNHLDPSIKKGGWTDEEDQLLLDAQAQLGNRWCEISKL